MRRRLFWLLALGGLVWLYLRRGARRPEPVESVPPVPGPDPAEELRRKLGETKERAEAPASPAPDEIDAMRESVHERARAAADEMRRSTSD